jgi:8-oxo-dGTP pyrophosphatase MutT (NUDIX family)
VRVKPSAVAAAPAATLVLLRDRVGGGIEALLIERHRRSKFAAGDYAFPGGKIEPGDAPADAEARCVGLTAAEAAQVLDLPAGPPLALGFWIGAIREAFEEVGVLLADSADGRPVDPDALAAYRAACQASPGAFWDMVRAERLRLRTDRLVYFAYWITPEEHPIRFAARFFAAPMPLGQDAIADGREVTAVRWIAPADALAARRRGELPLRLPTATNLGLLADASSVTDALERLRAARVVPIRPRLVVEAGRQRAILPGEPGYY